MEEDRKKSPSLPSNYLTLVQLQDRWLKEQQRKQREKEEEEEEEEKRKRREKEEEERNRENRESRKRQDEIRERSKAKDLSRRWAFQKNRRNQSVKSFRTIGMSELKLKESQVGVIVVDDGERKIDDLKKKKNKRNWKKKGKPRAEDDLTGGTEKFIPEYEEAENKTPVVLTETDGEKEGVTRRNGKKLVANGMVWEKKIPVDRSAEIGRQLNDLSLSGGKGGYERYARNTHGGQWKYKRDYGRFNCWKLQKARDSNLAWVRKGDTSDANLARV